MTDRPQPRRADQRTTVERAADHAALEGLADGLLPALIAKLGASGLGELEVREGTWRVRLRRPLGASAGIAATRRPADRAGRVQPGHEGHGHAPAAIEARRGGSRAMGGHSTNGTDPGEPIAAERHAEATAEEPRLTALSPAVGVFRPGLAPGARVRAGDRVAVVDQLGIPVDVTSPVDGIVGATLVDAGDAVEYGEALVVVEPAGSDA
jgi:acetyl-CoA carboxylase biotin carboxyl carrier protein